MRVKLVVALLGLITTMVLLINNSYPIINDDYPAATIKKEVNLSHHYTKVDKWRQYSDYETYIAASSINYRHV